MIMRKFVIISLLVLLGSNLIPQASAETSPVSASIPNFTTTNDDVPPTRPILLRPVDVAVTADSTPELVWIRSVDPDGNYVAYTVYLDGVATYLGISNDNNGSGNGYTSRIDGSEVRLIPSTPLPDGIHSWQVTAFDYANNQSSSTIWHFSIDTQPPPITVTRIDKYRDPVITENTIFDIVGPKNVILTIVTEPFSNVRISYIDTNSDNVLTLTGTSDSQGHITFAQDLAIGKYQVQISVTDTANLTALHIPFYLDLQSVDIIIPVPGFSPPPTISLPGYVYDLPSTIAEYPATIARVSTRLNIAIVYLVMLAVSIIFLIIFLNKRWNLELLYSDARSVEEATIIVPSRQQSYHLRNSHHGRIYIPGLESKTELSIIVPTYTVKLCLLESAKTHTIVL